MASQNKHLLDSVSKNENPQSIYELLVYDNQKLASKSGGPHIIMRRTLRGSEQQDADLSKHESDDGELARDFEEDSEASELMEHEQIEKKDKYAPQENTEMVGVDTISNYIASLSHHVQSDVLRVVDAIIDLENDPIEADSGTVIEKGEAESIEPNHQEDADNSDVNGLPHSSQGGEEKKEELPVMNESDFEKESERKKGVELSDIFNSLKNARKRAQQKTYSYTNKVEYEDR